MRTTDFTKWIKLIHLCALKCEFGNLRLFREGAEIVYVLRALNQVN